MSDKYDACNIFSEINYAQNMLKQPRFATVKKNNLYQSLVKNTIPFHYRKYIYFILSSEIMEKSRINLQ